MSSPPDRLPAALLCLATLATVILSGPITSRADTGTGLRITEFAAESDGSFPDEDGEASDWIELRNTGDSPIDLGGYFLTDDASDPTRWRIPRSIWRPVSWPSFSPPEKIGRSQAPSYTQISR